MTVASSCAWIVSLVVVAGDGELDDGEVVDAGRDDVRLDALGQLARDAVDRLVIFCSAVARSVPYVKDAWMIEALVVLVAVVDSSPGTPWIADLDRRRDVVADDLGRGARVGRDDDELRELDRGDELLLEAREREPAEDRRDDRDEGDERAVLEAQDGEVRHGWPSLWCRSDARLDAAAGMHGQTRRIRECIEVSVSHGEYRALAADARSIAGADAAVPDREAQPRPRATRERRACRRALSQPRRAVAAASRAAPSRPRPC